MLAIQPPLISKYFHLTVPNPSATGLAKSFFMSFEDALWRLIEIGKVETGSMVLLPEFFCFDVVSNMQAHGLKVITYPQNRYLVTDYKRFTYLLRKYKPGVVIVFHSVGVHNKIIDKMADWTHLLPASHVVIEDCVHKVLNEKQIKIKSPNHYLIDSLRKVSPVQGSFVYSKNNIYPISFWQSILTFPYQLGVVYYWLIMQVFLVLANASSNLRIEKLMNLRAERAMRLGYDLIGNSKQSAPGWAIMRYLGSRLAIEDIERVKLKQASEYFRLLSKLKYPKLFWLPKLTRHDFSKLRGYPVILAIDKAEKLLQNLRSEGIILRFELDDSPWSKKYKIIYLPMGVHIENRQIKRIIKTFKTTVKKISQEM